MGPVVRHAELVLAAGICRMLDAAADNYYGFLAAVDKVAAVEHIVTIREKCLK